MLRVLLFGRWHAAMASLLGAALVSCQGDDNALPLPPAADASVRDAGREGATSADVLSDSHPSVDAEAAE